MKKRLYCPVLISLFFFSLYASPVDMMIGSRGFGFGGAYVAIADDPSAAYWNPAGLSNVKNISLMESNWILQDITGLNVNYVSFAVPIKHVGTVSGSWLFQYARLEQMGMGGEIEENSAGENTFSLSIGRQLWDKLLIFENTSIGFSINRHTFITSEGNGAGLGFDLGLQTKFPLGFSFGITGRTIATDVMGDKIDPELRFGIGWNRLIKEMHSITIDVDGSYKMNRDYTSESRVEPARNNLKGYGGLEYAIKIKDMEIALRGGGNGLLYNTLDSYGFAFGAGFKYLGYSVQYAFKGDTDPEVTLGFGHRITVVLELNRLVKKSGSESEKIEEVHKNEENIE